MPRREKQRQRSLQLYSERLIRNEDDLLEFIQALDEDEGIRVQGNLKNHAGGGFIFVGYYRGSYCANICDKVWNKKLRKYLAGGKDEWYYFDTGKQAFNFVIKEAKHPLLAWLY
jgi:hypothetical protein